MGEDADAGAGGQVTCSRLEHEQCDGQADGLGAVPSTG